jgi:hypothetical protein
MMGNAPGDSSRRGSLIALVALALAAITFTSPSLALASQCRPERGYRNVATVPLDPAMLEFMQQVGFAKTAKLYSGPPGIESIEGIEAPAESYSVKVDWNKDRAAFSLDDGKGHAGTLTLLTPAEISMFEIDTRYDPVPETGAVLYKEWRLSGKAEGTGPFKAANDSGQRLSLILQGRGNDCITSTTDFNFWTLAMEGPKGNYLLYGDLVPAQ